MKWKKLYSDRYGSSQNSKVINHTEINFSGLATLKATLDLFHRYTGTNVSIVVDENLDVYGTNWLLFTLFLIPTIGCGIATFKVFSILSKEKQEKEKYGNIKNSSAVYSEYNTEKDPFEEYSNKDSYK